MTMLRRDMAPRLVQRVLVQRAAVRWLVRRAAGVAPALWLSLGPGCIDARSPGSHGANKPSTPTAVFPEPGDLARLPSLPAPSEAFAVDAVVVDNWSVAAAAPTQ